MVFTHCGSDMYTKLIVSPIQLGCSIVQYNPIMQQ